MLTQQFVGQRGLCDCCALICGCRFQLQKMQLLPLTATFCGHREGEPVLICLTRVRHRMLKVM